MTAVLPSIPSPKYEIGTKIIVDPYLGIIHPWNDGTPGIIDGIRLIPEGTHDPEGDDDEDDTDLAVEAWAVEYRVRTPAGEWGWVNESVLEGRGYKA